VTPSHHPVILCIEDQASPLALRKLVLEKSGYTVLGAASGKQAFKLLKAFHVDLVLSDHFLRGELGTAIAAKIKAENPNIPILLISGMAGGLTGPDSTKHVDGIIQKDAGPTSLLVSVARALKL